MDSPNRLLDAAGEIQTFCEQNRWPFCFIGGIAVLHWGEARVRARPGGPRAAGQAQILNHEFSVFGQKAVGTPKVSVASATFDTQRKTARHRSNLCEPSLPLSGIAAHPTQQPTRQRTCGLVVIDHDQA